MAAHKSRLSQSNRPRIDMTAEDDIRAWALKFGVTEKGLRVAAGRVGDDAEAVRRELGGQQRWAGFEYPSSVAERKLEC
jgi:hypothetical protein